MKCIIGVLVCLTVTSCSVLRSDRNRRALDDLDFEKLSDDDVFALLEKEEDYNFPTEKDINLDLFNFDDSEEYEGGIATHNADVVTDSTTDRFFNDSSTVTVYSSEPSSSESALSSSSVSPGVSEPPSSGFEVSFSTSMASADSTTAHLQDLSSQGEINTVFSSTTEDVVGITEGETETSSMSVTPFEASSTEPSSSHIYTTFEGTHSASEFTTSSPEISETSTPSFSEMEIPTTIEISVPPSTEPPELTTVPETTTTEPSVSTEDETSAAPSTAATQHSGSTVTSNMTRIPSAGQTKQLHITTTTPKITEVLITKPTVNTAPKSKPTTTPEPTITKNVSTKKPFDTLKPKTPSKKPNSKSPLGGEEDRVLLPYDVPKSNATDSTPLCFRLINPDNTLSDECFYPVGVNPPIVEKSAIDPRKLYATVITTTRTRTTLPTTTTEKSPVTTEKPGRICFKLANPAGPGGADQCFYLDVNLNPSEIPTTPTIATLAPHRIFEITEEPPPLPAVVPVIVRPPTAKPKYSEPGEPHAEIATFAPDRIFEIPLQGVRTGVNSRPDIQVQKAEQPVRKVATLAPDRKAYIPELQDLGSINLVQKPEETVRPAAGRNVVRFQPRARTEGPSRPKPQPPVYEYGNRKYDSAHSRFDPGAPSQPRVGYGSNQHDYHYEPPRFPSGGAWSSREPERGNHIQKSYPDGTFIEQRLPQGLSFPVFGYPDSRYMTGHSNVLFIPSNGSGIPFSFNLGGSPRSQPRFVLIPVEIRDPEPLVSNVRTHPGVSYRAQPEYQGREPDHQSVPSDPQVAVSNIRMRIPEQGTFSQRAFATNQQGQAVFNHLGLDMSNENPYALHTRNHAYNDRRSYPPVFDYKLPLNPTAYGDRPSVNPSENAGSSSYRTAFKERFRSSKNSDHQPRYTVRSKRAAERPNIEDAEAISLGFVVDTTASMRTELNEVKRYALIIMNEVLNNRGSHIDNFIFVPIHDEDPVHETQYLVTRNRDVMSRTISKINVSGGGTCPENSMVGLLKAIDLAEKDSHIFVFTDAYAKDYRLVPEIIKMIQRKKPRVYFMLTGECKEAVNDYQKFAFDTIAAASTGLVAKLDKDPTHLRKVLEAVAREFEKNRRILTEHEGDPTGSDPTDIKINVDPGLKNLSLTSTGHNTHIDVLGPRGPPDDIQTVLNMTNIQILSVPNPDPGEWTVSVTSPDSPFKFVASGISSTDFIYGFSVPFTNETSRLSKHPKQGVANHLLLVAKDPSVLLNISNVQLIVDNEVYMTLPVTVVDKELGIYSGGPVLFPDTSFKIRINAFTKEGYPLTRLTKATIIPQMPGPPEIDCKKQMVATAGLPFNMTCSIESLVPMDIEMYKMGSAQRHTLRYSQTSTVVLHFNQLNKEDEGTYVIHAENAAGRAIQNVDLIVEEVPPSVSLDPNLVGTPGRRLVIKCEVSSYTKYSIRWMKSDSPPDNFYRGDAYNLISNSDRVRIEDSKIVMDPVRPDDEGWYICSARNNGGERAAQTYLVIQEPPTLSIDSSAATIPFKRGDEITVTCLATKGLPLPALKWYNSYGQLIKTGSRYSSNQRVRQRDVDALQLLIFDASKVDEGTYTCFGSNIAGRDSVKVMLQYSEHPQIEAREKRVDVLTGESLHLECVAYGTPQPEIKWTRRTSVSFEADTVESNRKDLPGQYLELREVTPRDSGTYICTATNIAGTSRDEIEVIVGVKPRIHRLTKKYVSLISQPVELYCGASGVPEPEITWRRADGSPVRGTTVDGVLKISSTQLEDGGSYVCLAQNQFGRAESPTVLVVEGAVKPKIMKSTELETVRTKAGETVNLVCPIIESVPPSSITWYLNGRPVQGYSEMTVSKVDGTLIITNFHHAIVGNYTCEAENPVGKDTKTVYLKHYDNPVIKPMPPILVEPEGNSLTVSCDATGDPVPEVTWQRRDGSVASDTNVLFIAEVSLADAGKYICRATNIAGINQTDFTLRVLVKPIIKEWEAYTYAKVGERVRLHCEVSGDPYPEIRWLKNDKQIKRIGIGYYIFEASYNSAGVYSCIAKNDAGEARTDTNLVVLETPLIQDMAPITEVIAGSSVELKCSAIGNPYPTLSWIFNGETLVRQEAGNESAILRIQRVSESDAGNYFCVANSSVGNDRRKTELRVLHHPIIVCGTDVFHVVPGKLAELNCQVSAVPRGNVTWYRVMKTGDTEEFGYSSIDGTLQFLALPENAGLYKIVASNRAGSASAFVNVVVLEKPSFSPLLPKTVDALVGSNVSLPCTAFGDPKPEISWDQLNYPVLPNKLIFDPVTGELHIFDVEIEDEGVYTCQARNKAGFSSHTIELSVSSRPKAKMNSWDLRDGVIEERRELTLTCDVGGRPFPEISWTKDGYPLSPSNHTFSRNKVRFKTSSSSSGVYTCTAKNAVGVDTASLTVNVTAKPNIDHPEDQHLTELEGRRDVELSCAAHGNPSPEVTWLKDNQELKAFPKFRIANEKLIISSLTSNMEGVFTCVAKNYLGEASKNFHLTVNSLPVITTGAPNLIEVYQFDDYALPCKAKGKPDPVIRWKIGNEVLPIGTFNEKHVILRDGTLTILNITVEDAGNYYCTATNKEGNDSKTHQLAVIVPPRLSSTLQNLLLDHSNAKVEIVQEAGTRRLVCPGGKGVWLKNDAPLVSSRLERGDDPHYTVKDGGRLLVINDATDQDIAEYSCIDQAGTRYDFLVDVVSRPLFYQDSVLFSEVYEAVDGQAVVVNCSARGNPEPRVLWQRKDPAYGWITINNYTLDGAYFSGSGNDVMHIPDVNLVHNGTYRCTARNREGKQSREFSIAWSGPPQLKGERKVLKKVAIGKQVTLTCQMDGFPEPTFAWEFTPKSWQWSTKKSANLQNTNSSLTIEQASIDEAGEYKCTATNSAGTAEQVFEIHVVEPPVLARTSTTNLTYKTFEDIELKCTSQGPEDEVRWMKGNVVLTKSDRISLSSLQLPFAKTHSHYLKILNASKEDTDTYKCIVFNIAGKAEQFFNVSVIVPPQVTLANARIDAEMSKPLRIHCRVHSDLKVEIAWHKDGKPLENNRVLGEDVYIAKTTKADEGNYSCTVSNGAGVASAAQFVHILVPPKMLNPGVPKVQILTRGSTLELKCEAVGDPEPSLWWTKSEENLINGTLSGLRISDDGKTLVKRNLTEEDAGLYACLAENSVRTQPPAEYHYEVIVLGQPEDHFPNGTLLNVTVHYGQLLELICPLAVFTTNISWYKGSQKLIPNADRFSVDFELSKMAVRDVQPEDGGVFTCRINGTFPVQSYTFAVTVIIPLEWGEWSLWSDCSRSCGVGEQTRWRECVLPPTLLEPAAVKGIVRLENSSCDGSRIDVRPCNVAPCPVDGGVGKWSLWTECTGDCGTGLQRRTRRCDNPVPSSGGKFCAETLEEVRECVLPPCPVHGNWSEWSDWGSCSATCGYSVRSRYRRCNNPTPSNGGDYCEGDKSEVSTCDVTVCPGDGVWSEWSPFSRCSRACGHAGVKKRTRICLNNLCGPKEKNFELVRCRVGIDVPPCRRRDRRLSRRSPRAAELLVKGVVNAETINEERIIVVIYPNGSINVESANLLKAKNVLFPYLHFLVPSVLRGFAEENNNLIHGFSINHGKFNYSVTYSFSSGETLKVRSEGLGVGPHQKLKFLVTALGTTPEANFNDTIEIPSYQDQFVQKGESSFESHARQELIVSGKHISYETETIFDIMPNTKRNVKHSVEDVKTKGIALIYDNKSDAIVYSSTTTISYKLKDDICPEGFALVSNKDHCEDVDECELGHKCLYSQICRNTIGSFKCTCPEGLSWDEPNNLSKVMGKPLEGSPADLGTDPTACMPGFTRVGIHCEDIDECEMDQPCGPVQLCTNTLGSYECLDSPCREPSAVILDDGTCMKRCNGTSDCKHGAMISESIKTILVQRAQLDAYEEIATLTTPALNNEGFAQYKISSTQPSLDFRIGHSPNGYDFLYSLSDARVTGILTVNVNAVVRDQQQNILNIVEFIIHFVNRTPASKRLPKAARPRKGD